MTVAEQLIGQYPERIISFYSARHGPVARPGTATLVPYYRTLSDLAIVYPRAWLESLRQDFETQQDELEASQWQLSYGADEMRIKLRPQQQVWCTVLSLIQHGCPGESTLGHQILHGRAPLCMAAKDSALDLDWLSA